MSDYFSMTVERGGGVHLVRLQGELDLAAAGDVYDALTSFDGCARVVADLSDLVFIDASGLSALVRAADEVAKRRGFLQMNGARAGVRRVFELTDLTHLLDG